MSEGLSFRVVLGRSLRLRCPSCGTDRIFTGLVGVKDRCAACSFNCRPEGGFYLGAIYINYTVTALAGLLTALPFVLANQVYAGIVVASVVAVAVAVSFFQYSRSLWLGITFWNGQR